MAHIEVKIPNIGDFAEVTVIELLVKAAPRRTGVWFKFFIRSFSHRSRTSCSIRSLSHCLIMLW